MARKSLIFVTDNERLRFVSKRSVIGVRVLEVEESQGFKSRCRFPILAAFLVLASACTGPINEETVVDMPTGYICDILGPDYLSVPQERLALFRELERRGEECPTRPVIRTQPFVPVQNQLTMPMMRGSGVQTTNCTPRFGGGMTCTTY